MSKDPRKFRALYPLHVVGIERKSGLDIHTYIIYLYAALHSFRILRHFGRKTKIISITMSATSTATESAQVDLCKNTATIKNVPALEVVEVKDSEEVLYTPWRLAFYDFWVLGLVTSYGWCCPTTTYLLPLFRANVRKNHLDIGVGSGYYLDPSTVPTTTKLTLIDSESHALAVAKARTKRSDATAIVANVLQPLPLSQKYDSVSMYSLVQSRLEEERDKHKA